MEPDILSNEKLLQLVLENIPSFVFWKDRESVYLGCNKNFADYAGFSSPEEVIGKNDYDMPWSKEESDFFREIDKAVMDSREPQINFEEPQTISDGSTRWLRTSKIPLFNAQGEVIGILGTYEDITDRKRMELELIQRNKHLFRLNARLETINADLEQFAYATSHDLQEPIRVIEGFAGLLGRKYIHLLDEKGQNYVSHIVKGTKRMSSLINQILSYSTVNQAKEPFKKIALGPIMDEIIQELDMLIRSRGAFIGFNIPKEKIACQPARIKMLFSNLITNGIKFNTSKQPTILINFEQKEREWYFSVSDNGIGIERTFEEYIFKPFKRLNNRDEFPGNGIGLSICRRIIQLHGGRIWCTSNESQGTTFHFTLGQARVSQGG